MPCQVSADENLVIIVVGAFYHYDENNPEKSKPAKGTIDWEITSGDGGSLSTDSSVIDSDGFAFVELTVSTDVQPDNIYNVKARLRRGSKSIVTGDIEVIHGLAANIEFVTDKPLYPADETTRIKVTATVTDQFDNLLPAETDVAWEYLGLGNIVTSDEVLDVNGQASATLVSGPLAEQQNISLNVDDYEDSTDLTILPLTVQLSSSADTLDIYTGQTAQITAFFTDINGQAVADGTVVSWFTTNGLIAGDSVTSGGIAYATINTQGGRVGKAYVNASSSGYGSDLLLRFTSSAGLYLEPTDLSTINVVGEPNTLVTISIIEALLTVVDFPFDELIGSQVRDFVSNLTGTSHGAVIDTQHHYNESASLYFNGHSYVDVPVNSVFQVAGGFSISAAIRPTASGAAKIIEKPGEYLLKIEANGLVSFSITTPNGTFKASHAFGPGNWHVVQGTFNDNKVIVTVDGESSQVTSSGQISLTSNALEIGKNFTGNINDFVFRRKFLVAIGGVDSNNQVDLGDSGQATITLTPQTDIPDFSKADFDVVAQSSNQGLIATVKMSAPGDQLAQRVDDAASNFHDKVMYVLGFLLPTEEVKSIAWEMGTLSGGGEANWRSVTKNSLLIIFNFAGGKIIKGIGGGAKVLAGAWSKLFSVNANSSLTLISENLLRDGCRAGNVDNVVGPFKGMLTYITGKSATEVADLTAMEISKRGFANLNKLHRTMGPLFIDTLIDINRTIRPAAGKKLISTLATLDKAILKNITDAEALKGLAKVLDKGIDGATIARVLKNDRLFDTTLPIIGKYSRNQLGKDLASVAHADGLIQMVKALKNSGTGVGGVAYEIRRGAALGADLKAFRKQIPWKSLEGKPLKDTDVDLITNSGIFNNLQLKSGKFGGSKKEEAYIQACIKKVGNIVYEVPDLSKVPQYMFDLKDKYPGLVDIVRWP